MHQLLSGRVNYLTFSVEQYITQRLEDWKTGIVAGIGRVNDGNGCSQLGSTGRAENSRIILQKPRHAALQNLELLDKWVCLSNMSGKQRGEGNGRGGDYTDGIVSTKFALTSFDSLYTGAACYSGDLWRLLHRVSKMTSPTNLWPTMKNDQRFMSEKDSYYQREATEKMTVYFMFIFFSTSFYRLFPSSPLAAVRSYQCHVELFLNDWKI